MDPETYIRSIYHFCYAQEILNQCTVINSERCIGCAYAVPNQLYHECITNTTLDIFNFFLEEALLRVCQEKVHSEFEKKIIISDVSSADIDLFKLKFDWNWWTQKNEISEQMFRYIKQSAEILSIFS